MKERLKQIRNKENMTMEKFGNELGVTKAAISKLEKGERNLTNQMIKAICERFNVREEWLRTGEGEMAYGKERNQIVAEFAADLIKEPESFKSRLIESMAKLDEKDWIELERIFDKISKRG